MKNFFFSVGLMAIFTISSCTLDISKDDVQIPTTLPEATGTHIPSPDSGAPMSRQDTHTGVIANSGSISLIDGITRIHQIPDALALDDACRQETDMYLEFKYHGDTNALTIYPLHQNGKLYFVADFGWYVDGPVPPTAPKGYLMSYDCSAKIGTQLSPKNIREILSGGNVTVGYISDAVALILQHQNEGPVIFWRMDLKKGTLTKVDFATMTGYAQMVTSIKKTNKLDVGNTEWNLVARELTMSSDTQATVRFSLDQGLSCLKMQEIYLVDFAKNSIVKKIGTQENKVCETY